MPCSLPAAPFALSATPLSFVALSALTSPCRELGSRPRVEHHPRGLSRAARLLPHRVQCSADRGKGGRPPSSAPHVQQNAGPRGSPAEEPASTVPSRPRDRVGGMLGVVIRPPGPFQGEWIAYRRQRVRPPDTGRLASAARQGRAIPAQGDGSTGEASCSGIRAPSSVRPASRRCDARNLDSGGARLLRTKSPARAARRKRGRPRAVRASRSRRLEPSAEPGVGAFAGPVGRLRVLEEHAFATPGDPLRAERPRASVCVGTRGTRSSVAGWSWGRSASPWTPAARRRAGHSSTH
jgi:hypothetical protein